MEEHYTNLFFSVFLHVLLLFIFLTIFFWSVIKNAESKSLYNEIDKSVESGLKCVTINEFFPKDEGNANRILY